MSSKGVVVSLVVAVALGLAALLLLRTPGGRIREGVMPVGARLLDLDPASVKSIVVRGRGGSPPTQGEQIVERTGNATGPAWRLVLRAPGRPEVVWALQTERIANLLRILASTTAIAAPEKGASVGEDPTVVEVSLADGTSREIRMASRALGGSGLVEVRGTQPAGGGAGGEGQKLIALVDKSLHDVFTRPGPLAWRETLVFGAGAFEASRIRMEQGQRAVALGKIEGRWRLREPIGAPVDSDAMTRLISALSQVRIINFFDGGAPEGGGGADALLGRPSGRIVIETDRRVAHAPAGDPPAADASPGSFTVQTATITLRLGQAAGSDSGKFIAALSEDGPMVEVSIAPLLADRADPMDPVRYVSRVATETQPQDVGSLVVETLEGVARPDGGGVLNRRLRRNLGQWTDLAPGGQESAVSPSESTNIADALTFLAKEGSASVLVERPASYAAIGRISLLSIGDEPLGAIEVGAAGGALVLRAADGPTDGPGVYRSYDISKVPALLAPLASIAKGTTPVRPAVGGVPTEPDIVK